MIFEKIHTPIARSGFIRSWAMVVLATSLATTWPCFATDDTKPVDPESLPWTAGIGRVTLSDQTIDEAHDQVRNLARKDAIEKATGSFLIRASDESVKYETGGSHFERYSRTIRREISGRIVGEKGVHFTHEEPAPGIHQVICNLEVRVAVEKQERNNAFEVQVNLRDSDSGVYRVGEELILNVRASLNCWITVFNVYADGTVAVLLPNERMPDNRVAAGANFVLPDHQNPAQKFIHFRLAVPKGQQRTDEYIAVVATLQEYSFLSNNMTDYGQGYIPAFEAAYTEFNNWILKIPASKRAEAEVFYSIIK